MSETSPAWRTWDCTDRQDEDQLTCSSTRRWSLLPADAARLLTDDPNLFNNKSALITWTISSECEFCSLIIHHNWCSDYKSPNYKLCFIRFKWIKLWKCPRSGSDPDDFSPSSVHLCVKVSSSLNNIIRYDDNIVSMWEDLSHCSISVASQAANCMLEKLVVSRTAAHFICLLYQNV